MSHKALGLVCLMFCLAIGVGVVVGRISLRFFAAPVPPAAGGLSDVLQLNDPERGKMKQVWEHVKDQAEDIDQQKRRVRQEQDQFLKSLLSEDQKRQYAGKTQECDGKVAALDSRRDALFGQGVEQTRTILSPSQWQTFEQIVKDRLGKLPDGSFETTRKN